jgi:hypothetical protein
MKALVILLAILSTGCASIPPEQRAKHAEMVEKCDLEWRTLRLQDGPGRRFALAWLPLNVLNGSHLQFMEECAARNK